MYVNTTTAPEVKLHQGLGATTREVTLGATTIPAWRHTPAGIQEYLTSMGWTSYSASDGDWMYQRLDAGTGYMTWEQAVTYCLVKPFLTEVNK